MTLRVFVLCPDYNLPSGGVRRLYRQADVLCRHGYEVRLLHQQRGFRCSWFANDTPVSYLGDVVLTQCDFLVVPEIYGPGIAGMARGVPKVIFNQNAYLTFQGFPADGGVDFVAAYRGPDIKAVFAVSENNAAVLRHASPGLNQRRLHYGIDPILAPRWPEHRTIAFMPRKNAQDVLQVLHLLRSWGALTNWDLVPIDGVPETEVATLLAASAIFLSFGTAEGCPLPPLEAMASGCVMVGYHGAGGREYFDPSFSIAIEAVDVLRFVMEVND